MKRVVIEIPNFIQEVKLAEKKQKKFYKQGSEIPDRFKNENYIFKKGKLFNVRKNEFVIKNSASAGKPRYKSIGGNDIWGRINHHIRNEMIYSMKKSFKPYLPKSLDLNFPLKITMEFHTPPRFFDWDIGNVWIYDKVLSDLLIEEKLIPDDSIRYISSAPRIQYIPVLESERKLRIIISEEDDERVLSHVLYSLDTVKKVEFLTHEQVINGSYLQRRFELIPTRDGIPGSIVVDEQSMTIYMSIGKKKILYGSCKDAIRRVFFTLVNYNADLLISSHFNSTFANFVKSELIDKGIKLFVYEGRNEVLSST